ncbi:serine/threonine-protein kinase [Streptomyces sp. NPDC059786]|uniref:serine/threonine-protein kinase n=1 Tax=Streptomyces sp. NPDC059786 TaxID=3346946 RepID=UPI0036509EDA
MHKGHPGSYDPERFGAFLVVGRLGAGGMGTVFLARSPGGRRVAVKTIRADLAADPAVRERFRREIAAARRVSGFWTTPVVDADPDAAMPWVATAYLDAPDLGRHVQEHGPLPVDQLAGLAAGLAEALAAIHTAGLVHRDLKPPNVLITEDGPRIIDFGIARADTTDIPLTTLGGLLGTPGYMSPEQANGELTGPASDIFSLGAVLYYAATGTGPFGHGTAPALLYRVVHDAPDLAPIPAGLRPALAACLHKEAERRPTAAALLSLLPAPPGPPVAGRPQRPKSSAASQNPAWWEQPTLTAQRSAPSAAASPPAQDIAWWSAGSAEPDPPGPAVATGHQAVEDYRAEQQRAAERGRAPGPRMTSATAGDVVEHAQFGIGTVVGVQGAGPRATVVVSFGQRKDLKRLQLRYAPMRKIDA